MDEPEVPNSHFVEEFVSEEGKNVLLLNKKIVILLKRSCLFECSSKIDVQKSNIK